jgi:hypothetical protein
MEHKSNFIFSLLLMVFLVIPLTSIFAQNRGWEFTSWEMKLKQVQDSLHDRQIEYTYLINDSKGSFLKLSIADYQSWVTDLFFALDTQFLYQVITKRKFSNKESQTAMQALEQLTDNFREIYGAPAKEVEDLTDPFCQFEYVWELEETKVTLTYCKTSTISMTVVYAKR